MAKQRPDQSFDPRPFREGAERRAGEREKRIAERAARARAFLPRLTAALREIDPEIEKIVLFGSLAKGTPKSEDFDIDIAVRSSRYLKIVSWALDQEWKIDVADLDSVDRTILHGIEQGGEALYESPR
jgi:predicted nucleotidyltransferase